jgi:hypothetical protein
VLQGRGVEELKDRAIEAIKLEMRVVLEVMTAMQRADNLE